MTLAILALLASVALRGFLRGLRHPFRDDPAERERDLAKAHAGNEPCAWHAETDALERVLTEEAGT